MSAPTNSTRAFYGAYPSSLRILPRLRALAPEIAVCGVVGVLVAGALGSLTQSAPAGGPAIISLAGALLIATGIGVRQRRELRGLRTEAARRDLETTSTQLTPHFLFNALNTLQALVRDEDRGAASRAVAGLGGLLRRSLHHQRPGLVSVDEEIALVRDYLDWQQLRFGDALDVEVSVDAGALSARVPGLTLQLLAENAVRHGALEDGRSERIKIRVRHRDDAVEIDVENRLPDSDRRPRPGLGLGQAAVRQRLALIGRGAHLHCSTAWGHHRARVRLPRTSAAEVSS